MSSADDAVRAWVAAHYPLTAPVALTRIRASTNDVYQVRAGRDRFVLKLYGAGWRTEPEVHDEVALLDHLAAKGILVATAIPGINRAPVQHVPTAAGDRLAVLFTSAPGTKPQPPFSLALYAQEGRATAALHQAADDFVSPSPRRPLDTTYLLAEPLALLQPLLSHADERRFVERFVGQLERAILTFARRGLDWGPVHGDLSQDNLHLTADGRIVWYDFDSGGPGWRAGDLQGWAARHPATRARGTAFVRGYHEVRPLDPSNYAAAPFLAAAFAVWGIAVDLRQRVLGQGDAAVARYLTTARGNLQAWAAYFGFPP